MSLEPGGGGGACLSLLPPPLPPRCLRGVSGTPVCLCHPVWMRGEPRGFGAGAAGEAVPPREPQLGGRPGDIARLPGCRALPLPPAPAAPRGLRSPRPPKTQQGGWGQRQAGSPMQQWGRGGLQTCSPPVQQGRGASANQLVTPMQQWREGGEVKTLLHHQLNV